MKTEQEQIEEMQEIIGDCYEFDSISAELGSGDGYINIEEAAQALIKAGYGDVSEYKAEIERLTHIIEYCENEELVKSKVKQAQIDVLNKVKKHIYDISPYNPFVTKDSVRYFIDELIKEVEDGKEL